MGADFWRWHGFPGDNDGFSQRGEVQLGPVCQQRNNGRLKRGMQMLCLAEDNRKLIRTNGQPALDSWLPFFFAVFLFEVLMAWVCTMSYKIQGNRKWYDMRSEHAHSESVMKSLKKNCLFHFFTCIFFIWNIFTVILKCTAEHLVMAPKATDRVRGPEDRSG